MKYIIAIKQYWENNQVCILKGVCLFFLGIILGFLIAPIKQGITCGNNCGNSYGTKEDFDKVNEDSLCV